MRLQMTDKQVRDGSEQLEARIAKTTLSQRADFVRRAIVGRTVREVADLTGHSVRSIQAWLQVSAVADVTDTAPTRRDVERVVADHAPEHVEDKRGREWVENYEIEGYKPAVAKALARSTIATENAVDRGALKVSKAKSDAATERIIAPGLGHHMKVRNASGKVRSASRTLDELDLRTFKSRDTAELIAEAHARWLEQIERVEALNPHFTSALADAMADRV